MKRLVTIVCLFGIRLLTAPLAAAEFVFDDFEDGALSPQWVTESSAYSLSEEGGALRVDYGRNATTGAWEQFNFSSIDHQIGADSIVKLEIRSTVSIRLALKVVNADGSELWLEETLPGDATLRSYYFGLDALIGAEMDTLYFYFDADSGRIASGTVEFASMMIGSSSAAPADPYSLELAVEAATVYLAESDAQNPVDAAAIRDSLAEGRAALEQESLSQAEASALAEAVFDALVDSDSRRGERFASSLSDPGATLGARRLFANLKWLASEGYTLFGMHDQTAYGVEEDGSTWYDDGAGDRSDVKTLTGTHGAVFSWDAREIVSRPFEGLAGFRKRVMQATAGGGVTTFCWHMSDPVYGRFYYNEFETPYNVVAALLEGGEHHDWYRNQLEKIAFFFKSLRGPEGQLAPVIFRPFHEHNVPYFWWGDTACSSAEYIALWRFTVEYLRDELGARNLIYAFSPDGNHFETNIESYKYAYPGDEYVDVLGMDFYYGVGGSQERDRVARRLEMMSYYAAAQEKVAALTEVGDLFGWDDQNSLEIDNWYTASLLGALQASEASHRIAYAATWRNASATHHFVPYPGHKEQSDFFQFYQDPKILFLDDLSDLSVADRRGGWELLAEAGEDGMGAELRLRLPFRTRGLERSHDLQNWSELNLPEGKVLPVAFPILIEDGEAAVFVRERAAE